jgi:hypothetical protein
MVKKNYSEEFRRDAVELYRVTEGATVAQIAADLGIAHGFPVGLAQNRGRADPQTRPHRGAARSGRNPRAGSHPAASAGPRTGSRIGEAEHRTRHPEGGGEIFRRGDELVSRFQFVADHSDTFEVKWLCQIVEVARSSFYAWVNAAATRTARTAADDALAQRIRAVHTTDTTYGAPRITAELNDGVPEVQRVNHKRVARVMRTAGIAGYRRRRRVRTTVADPANQKVPDLLSRDFTAAAVNTKYVGDIT